jgi:hypothetical protein
MRIAAIVLLAVALAAGPAGAVILPLLTNNSFVYAGWVFGSSAFGSGRF